MAKQQYIKDGKAAVAIVALRRSITLCPTAAEAHFSVGFMMAHQQSIDGQTLDRYDDALRHLRLATQIAPIDLHYMNYLARVYKIAAKHGEAIEVFEQQISLDPSRVTHNACEVVWLRRRLWAWKELSHWTELLQSLLKQGEGVRCSVFSAVRIIQEKHDFPPYFCCMALAVHAF